MMVIIIMDFYLIFLLFITYAFLGWLMESIYAGITSHKWTSRGFLIGPYCPIYGYGALLLIILLTPIKDNLLLVFILSVLICAVIEYLASLAMEKIFHARWWDYSKKSFNLQGRICLETIIPFGLFGLLIVCFLQPLLITFYLSLPSILMISISALLLTIFLTDNIISSFLIYHIRDTIKMRKEDNTEEINQAIKEVLFSKSKFNRRILNAYPNFQIIVYKK